MAGFDDHMNKLTPSNNKRNPWFRDYWEDMFNCNVVDTDTGFGRDKHRRRYRDGERVVGGPGGGRSR